MDNTAFKDYLEKRYYDQTNYYDKASGKNQKKYRQFQWILIVLSALTPVLAALDGTNGLKLQFLVVIISALVAILTTGLKTFQYQELWANYRCTNELLKPEIFYYNFNVGPYGEEGIDKETAKKIVKTIKESGIKVQGSIMDEQVRVTGKKLDDLQTVIALIKKMTLDLPLQFINFRN